MRDDRRPLPRFDAVSLDVGGVLIMPDRRMVSRALTRAGVRHDSALFCAGHYRAMAALDRRRSRPEELGEYTRGFVPAVGTPDAQLEAGATALTSVLGLCRSDHHHVDSLADFADRALAARGEVG